MADFARRSSIVRPFFCAENNDKSNRADNHTYRAVILPFVYATQNARRYRQFALRRRLHEHNWYACMRVIKET